MIRNPLAVRDTGEFKLSVFKDAAMTNMIATNYKPFFLDPSDLKAGEIDVISVSPATLDEQT